MIRELTGDDLYVEILMLRTINKNTFLLLESDADCNVLDPYVDEDKCETMPGYSKTAVLRAIELVDSNSIEGVVALVDRDWMTFCEPLCSSGNCFVTDRYDLDATIFFAGDIAHKLFAVHGTKADRKSLLQDHDVKDVSEAVARIALPLGVLRYLSHRDRHGLNLRDFPIEQAMSQDCSATDVGTLVELAFHRSKNVPTVSKDELAKLVVSEIASVSDIENYCSGHDIARTVATMISRRLKVTTNREAVARTLRACWSLAELTLTRFHADLQTWSNANGRPIWKSA